MLLFIVINALIINICNSFYYKAASYPIINNLKTYQKSNTTSINKKQIITKNEFLQRVLDIKSNENMTINIDNWNELKESGLYLNLSSQIIVRNNQIYLEISGIELPSRTISPEIAVNDIFDSKDITGGITFQDRNLFGIGQRLYCTLQKNDVLEDKGGNPLSFSFNWFDNYIGKNYKSSVSIESDYKVVKGYSTGSKINKLVNYNINKLSANIKWLPKRMMNFIIFELEPYVFYDETRQLKNSYDIISNRFVSGAKSIIQFYLNHGNSVKVGYDSGFTNDIKSIDKLDIEKSDVFRIISLDFSTPNLLVHKFNNFLVRSNLTDSSIRLYNKYQYKFMRSYGVGCIPLLHYARVSDSHLIRGYPHPTDELGNPLSKIEDYERHSQYHVLKYDIHSESDRSSVSTGVFVDIAANIADHNSPSFYKSNPLACIGLSFRFQGFKCEVGWPIITNSKPRMYFGLDS